jgi:arylsulfatase A-like enzyme
MIWLGLFFGVAAGAAEVAFRLFASSVLDRSFLKQGWNIVWAVPLAHLLLFGILGLFLALVWTRWRGEGLFRVALVGLVAVGVFAVLLNYHSLHLIARTLLSLGIAVQFGGFLWRHPRGFRRFLRAVTLPAIGLVAITPFAFRAKDAVFERRAMANLPKARTNAPNVLLVVMDVVRAADMSLYGYARKTTPNLDRFAEQSVVFDNAFSTAPWTLPSHASMFTGRYPHEMSADWAEPLDDMYPTLAERLRDNGYVTAGFVANYFYGMPEYGLNRGFIHYESRRMNLGSVMNTSAFGSLLLGRFNRFTKSYYRPERRRASEINERVIHWLPPRGTRPFFVFVNYIDAHLPYVSPPPYDLKFARTEPPTRHNRIGQQKTDSELRGLHDVYDGAIAYEDAQLAALLQELRRRGQLSNTVLIVTSDHGEEFAEHGWVSHGNGLNLPALHVPLLVSYPGRIPAGTRITDQITLRDLPATVVDLAGLRAEVHFPGRSLSRHWDSTQQAMHGSISPLLSEVKPWKGESPWYAGAKGEMHSIISGRYHYILNGDKREELYDIVADPWEKTDLAKRPDAKPVLMDVRAALTSAMGSGAQSTATVGLK